MTLDGLVIVTLSRSPKGHASIKMSYLEIRK